MILAGAVSAVVLPAAATGVTSPGRYNTHTLSAVDLAFANDGWPVGGWYGTDSGARSLTIAKHWDGTSWTIVDSPSPGKRASELVDVSASSATDVWAVGTFYASAKENTLVLHWDGTQ